MAQDLVWRGPQVQRELETRILRNTNAAVQLVRTEAVRSINRSQPTARAPSGSLVGLDPSKPGEPPKRLTGRLIQSIRGSVRREGNRIVGEVGTNVVYARRLEFGFVGTDSRGRTISQGPRPFLRPALLNNTPRIKRLLGR